MEIRPITIKAAIPFVAAVHRRLPRLQGAMWAVQVREGGVTVGVACVGYAARVWNADDVLTVLRVAVLPGHPNACSMLYGAAARMARAQGARSLCTYTHLDEHGSSLHASGWVPDVLTAGGEWSRERRHRAAAVDAAPKRRWWAPWSDKLRCQIPSL